jgi:hypothetical protein
MSLTVKEKFINSEMATDIEVANAIATKVFGNNFLSIEDSSETSNSSLTTYVNKLVLTTPNLPLGSYLVTANYKLKCGANRAATIRLVLNSTILKTDEPLVTSVSDFGSRCMNAVIPNISGIKTIKLDFKVGNALNSSSSTATLAQASLIFYRIS